MAPCCARIAKKGRHLGYELAERAGQTMLERLEAIVSMIGGN
jgi:hypothetical protein